MILPGISGSFLLVMMGMYTEVLGAVNDRELCLARYLYRRRRRRSRALLNAAQLAPGALSHLGDRRDDRPDARLDACAVALAERHQHHHTVGTVWRSCPAHRSGCRGHHYCGRVVEMLSTKFVDTRRLNDNAALFQSNRFHTRCGGTSSVAIRQLRQPTRSAMRWMPSAKSSSPSAKLKRP